VDIDRRFGGIFLLHVQGRRVGQAVIQDESASRTLLVGFVVFTAVSSGI
jgi:hypothetical protein